MSHFVIFSTPDANPLGRPSHPGNFQAMDVPLIAFAPDWAGRAEASFPSPARRLAAKSAARHPTGI